MSLTPQRASSHRASHLFRLALWLDLAGAVLFMAAAGLTVAIVAILFAGMAFAGAAGNPGLELSGDAIEGTLAAPEVASDVDIQVTGVVARVRVRQLFHNPTGGWVEGVYLFPLPERAAVDRLAMVIGRRQVEGRIEERRAADKIYAQARAAGKKAALLSSERPNIFTAAVANIGPGESVLIEIEYQERIRWRDGEYRLRFPMVVGPRWVPPPGALARVFAVRHAGGEADGTLEAFQDAEAISAPVPPPALGPANPLSLRVRLEPGLPLAALDSPHHQMVRRDLAGHGVELELAEGPVRADRDFELTWRPAVAEASAALFLERGASHDYAMVMLAPPPAADLPRRRQSREVIHVIDTSGSMGGASIRQAKAALAAALDDLDPVDRFNIIRFASDHGALYAARRRATPAHLAEARAYVQALEAGGGTHMAPALVRALGANRAGDGALRQVVFVTDGAVSNEADLFRLIRDRLGEARLFTVAIGSAPNNHFMRLAARAGRGTFTHIGDEAQVASRIGEGLARLTLPVLTDIEARFDGAREAEVWPAPIPDLYAGEPIVFLARIDPTSTTLRVLAKLDGAAWERDAALHGAIEGGGIAKLWAREKIAGLETRRLEGVDPERLRREIVALGLEHELVTRHTSLVAVELTPSRPTDAPLARREVPLNLPAGWDHGKVFGAPQHQRKAGIAQSMRLASRVAAAPQAAPRAAIALPATATTAPWHRVLGALLVISALLLAVGWGRWARD